MNPPRTVGPYLIFAGPAGPTAIEARRVCAVSPLITDGGIAPGASMIVLDNAAGLTVMQPAETVLAAVLAAQGHNDPGPFAAAQSPGSLIFPKSPQNN